MPPALRMLSLVKGMDAVSYAQLRNLTACSGYPILLGNGTDEVNVPNMLVLVNGMDAVRSPNPYGC